MFAQCLMAIRHPASCAGAHRSTCLAGPVVSPWRSWTFASNGCRTSAAQIAGPRVLPVRGGIASVMDPLSSAIETCGNPSMAPDHGTSIPGSGLWSSTDYFSPSNCQAILDSCPPHHSPPSCRLPGAGGCDRRWSLMLTTPVASAMPTLAICLFFVIGVLGLFFLARMFFLWVFLRLFEIPFRR